MERYLASDDDTRMTAHDSHTAARAPFSFHYRSLQLAIPQTPQEFELMFEEQLTDPFLFQRTDSAIGTIEDLRTFVDAEDMIHSRLDDTRYRSPLSDVHFY
jgi:hypothetical protein